MSSGSWNLLALQACFRDYWALFLFSFTPLGAYYINILLMLCVMSYILGAQTTRGCRLGALSGPQMYLSRLVQYLKTLFLNKLLSI